MIFTITCDQFNLGTVFLIWSIHYLTGKKNFYFAKNNVKIEIPDNPLLRGITAHKFLPNHGSSIQEFNEVLEKVKLEMKQGELNHIKYTPKAATILDYHVDKNSFHEHAQSLGLKTINVSCDGLQHLIGFLRFNHEQPNWQGNMETIRKHCTHYWPDFFKNPEIFNNNLNTLHDIREGIAFHVRPYDFWADHERKHLDFVKHTRFEDLLFQGQDELSRILSFLKLDCDQTKLESWSQVHEVWKENLGHYIAFTNDIELIIENTLANKSMDLQKYKLDVLKEGVLLHLLMFKHDLNLVIDIEEFPNNTQDLYKLLGKNPRTGIQKIYD